MSGQKPREIALNALQRRPGGEFIETVLDNALAGAPLSPADRGLCQELVYGIVRWQETIDWLIHRKTAGRAQKPMLQNLLRLGLYQIFWLDRIPNHAAVHETVELAKLNGLQSQSGFVNAVLRGYLREFDATKKLLSDLKTGQPYLGYSHPEWLASRWQTRWGPEKAGELMARNNTPPKTFARVNTLKVETAKLLDQWREEKVEYDFVHHDWLDENLMFELKSHSSLNQLPSFQQGFFYVQDPSTILAVRELAPQPGESILDLCSAPGGKLTYIAQLMRNEGTLVAHDTSTPRLRLIEENCVRLGITCVRALQASALSASDLHPERMEITQPRVASSELPWVKRRKAPYPERVASPEIPPFDRVLIDAPCSNTGVLRRRVDLRWRIRVEEIERLRAGQLGLLSQGTALLKPGGTLVYSTCSLEPEENALVVNEFLSGQPAFKLEHTRELLPFLEGVDGAYVARMTRTN